MFWPSRDCDIMLFSKDETTHKFSVLQVNLELLDLFITTLSAIIRFAAIMRHGTYGRSVGAYYSGIGTIFLVLSMIVQVKRII